MTPLQKAKLNIDELNKLESDLVKFLKKCSNGLKDDRKIYDVIDLIQKQRDFSIDVILMYGDNL